MEEKTDEKRKDNAETLRSAEVRREE